MSTKVETVLIDDKLLEVIDDLIDLWFDVAAERRMKFPVTFLLIGMQGNYLCGMLRKQGRTCTYRVTAEHDSPSLFKEPPHHVVLMDSTGRTTRLTRNDPETLVQ